ncbi:MAG: PDZ domain-containing protein [Pyrinomonadaceae bacterium]
MNQETSAQKKRPAGTRTRVVEVKPVSPEIGYTISMSKPWTHLLEVEMRIKWPQMPERIEVKMPVWTPGSYLIREYARQVQNLAVKDTSAIDLAWSKINKNTWQIYTAGAKEFTVTYLVYSNELTVRTNDLNDEHAFWNNAATLLFVKDQLNAPSTVKVAPFANWRVATGLPPVEGQANTFRAENYDVLYDSPFEVSDFKEVSFDVEGKKHRIVMSGEGNYDLDKLAVDTAKIIAEGYRIFGEFGYKDYTFIINLRGGGGLEHLNSTALQANRFAFRSDSKYKSFLALVAHEYFHNWNVKRIRPDALGPFDYENENYTKLLWVAEGATAYYEGILLRRAGFITDKEFLKDKASLIKQLQERPGRFETSLENASFDAWIKYYRPDENAVNNQISYYDKGEIVIMMLDITIRTFSGGTKSFNDVLRYLYSEYFKNGKNYTPGDFQKVAEMMAGTSLDDFFRKYVRGTAEIDYAGILSGIGLRLNAKEVSTGKAYIGSDSADGAVTIRSVPAIGADLAEENGKLTVKLILANTPAFEQGLNTGDQIIAVDGYRANQAFMQSYIGERGVKDKVRFTVFRFDKLRDITITLRDNSRTEYEFAPLAQPSDGQKKLYREYLNTDLN